MSMKDGKGWKWSKESWLIHKKLIAAIKSSKSDNDERERKARR